MRTLLGTLAVALFSSSVLADDLYLIDSDASVINFATIKKQYIVEPATISELTGSINDEGMVSISANLSSINTGVEIRDTRVQDLFFHVAQYPAVHVGGKIPLEILKGSTPISKASVTLDVTLYGSTQPVVFPVSIVNTGEWVMVYSSKPVIVAADSFGIPKDNLNELSATVGNIGISTSVPVSVNLVFKRIELN